MILLVHVCITLTKHDFSTPLPLFYYQSSAFDRPPLTNPMLTEPFPDNEETREHILWGTYKNNLVGMLFTKI